MAGVSPQGIFVSPKARTTSIPVRGWDESQSKWSRACPRIGTARRVRLGKPGTVCQIPQRGAGGAVRYRCSDVDRLQLDTIRVYRGVFQRSEFYLYSTDDSARHGL